MPEQWLPEAYSNHTAKYHDADAADADVDVDYAQTTLSVRLNVAPTN